MTERTTTLALYWSDLLWLQQRQREVSFEREKTITMPELIRVFVETIKAAEAGAGA